ncbi:MAG: pyridoxamine 5'-phosphate oxidase [Cyclobacteriaceae bacterium]
MDISKLRERYAKADLTKVSVDSNPIRQFRRWFDEAIKAELLEPNAMILTTVDTNSQPTQRTVLLKYFDEKGFVFFTNYHSQKAQHLEHNNAVSMLFPWYQLSRQVIISGRAEKISNMESARYFLSRPFGSQLGAWISHQSKVISSRNLLEIKMAEMKRKFSEGKVPVPDFWGGYRVAAHRIEFIKDHKKNQARIAYQKSVGNWQIE